MVKFKERINKINLINSTRWRSSFFSDQYQELKILDELITSCFGLVYRELFYLSLFMRRQQASHDHVKAGLVFYLTQGCQHLQTKDAQPHFREISHNVILCHHLHVPQLSLHLAAAVSAHNHRLEIVEIEKNHLPFLNVFHFLE